MKLTALRLSVAMNILLAGVAVALGWQAMLASGSLGADPRARAAAAGPEEQPGTVSLLSQLRKCDIPEGTAKQLIALHLLDSNRQSAPDEYWTPRAIRESKRQMAEFAAAEQARARILQIEGHSAAEDEAFRSLFRRSRSRSSGCGMTRYAVAPSC